MKTWETFSMERYNKGREDGREIGRVEGREIGRAEGREIGRAEGREEVRKKEVRERVIREIRERLARREAAERGDLDVWLDEILSELSENGGGENRRRPRD